jgi:hypothetical protein
MKSDMRGSTPPSSDALVVNARMMPNLTIRPTQEDFIVDVSNALINVRVTFDDLLHSD